jgi:hypothetical protein
MVIPTNVTIHGKVYVMAWYVCSECSYNIFSRNPGNFPTGKFPQENFGKSGKLPDGKISPGEFREIRETSRRENFHRRFIQQHTIFFYENAL